MLLIIGRDAALLEGLAQGLARTGQRVNVASSLGEADEGREGESPVLIVVERALLEGLETTLPAFLVSGGALVTWHGTGEGEPAVPLPRSLARQVLADLELPLERARLSALAEHAITRARTVGRSGTTATPEHPAS